MNVNAYLAVGLGSALGSVLRYGVSLVSMAVLGSHFPWGTLLVNVLGSCLIGWIAATTSRLPRGALARQQPLLIAGFCGGFTTFSLFSLETLHLTQQSHLGLALLYGVGSLPLCVAAAWVGERLAFLKATVT
ncbi:fluoride efflux transporter CrcB [Halomonas sp. CnH100-B]|uniref:fluoride efflux transporter CrcB n=1 Tax=Halomonas sp. CnH100-B TaxID=2954490 RepID=UPI002096B03B|nr:fluoride efflux transporter CrcB [Halomonas sp. CnH100-B]MCO7229151.1 fluoride efflux transporter CrcB [Halomonas sp. CnH100-B]